MNPIKLATLSTSLLCCSQVFATPMIISDYEADKRYVAFSMSPISQNLEVSDGTGSGNDSRDLMAVNLSFSNVQDSLGSVTPFYGIDLTSVSARYSPSEVITRWSAGLLIPMGNELNTVLKAGYITSSASHSLDTYSLALFTALEDSKNENIIYELGFAGSQKESVSELEGGESLSLYAKSKFHIDKWSDVVVGVSTLHTQTVEDTNGNNIDFDPSIALFVDSYFHPVRAFSLFIGASYQYGSESHNPVGEPSLTFKTTSTVYRFGLQFEI